MEILKVREDKHDMVDKPRRQRVFQFSSVAQSCPTLCDAMDCSTPDFPVHHQLPEHAQTHVHWVGDAIQPSHPLSSPSPPAFNLSQHQGLFQWVSSLQSGGQSIGVSASASVLPMNIQNWFPLRFPKVLLGPVLKDLSEWGKWKSTLIYWGQCWAKQIIYGIFGIPPPRTKAWNFNDYIKSLEVKNVLIGLRNAIPIPQIWTGEEFHILNSLWLSFSSLESVMCLVSQEMGIFRSWSGKQYQQNSNN